MSLLFLIALKSVPHGRPRQHHSLVEAFHGVPTDRTASLRCDPSRTAPRSTSVQSVCWDVTVAVV